MQIFSYIKSLFQKKEAPKVKGTSTSSLFSINYNLNKQVYFEFYKKNPYIFAAIDKIKTDIGANGIELQKKVGKVGEDFKPIDNSLLTNLINYRNPNIKENIKTFLASLVRDIEIFGETYVYIQRTPDGSKVIGVNRCDPRFITPVITDKGVILGYIQNLKGQRAFLVDEMLHFYENKSLEDEKIGESKMTSLFLNLETDLEARESNLAFFKNNQTPASLVVVDSSYEIDDKEDKNGLLNQIKEIFNSGNYEGGKNMHRTALVEGIKEIIKVQDKISDMEFLEMMKFTSQLVYTIYQVNPDVLGITENSNRSVGEAQATNYWDTISNKEELYSQFLTTIVEMALGEGYRVVILQDSLRLLASKAKIAGELYKDKGIITLNEAREIIQYSNTTDGDKFASSSNIKITTEE